MKLLPTILFVLCAVSGLAGASNDKPNIVLIVADHMGASDIGPYGATDIATPSLDTLAAQGIRFTNYYAAAPICGPSRAAMLTGQYPARIDFEDNIGQGSRLSAKRSTLPSLLKRRGYQNGIFGKWHLGHTDETDPLAHGFDEFLGYHEWSVNHYTHRNDEGKEALTLKRSVVERDGYLTDIITDESIRFMEQHRDAPFFLYVAYNAALLPYLGPNLPADRWDVGFGLGTATRKDYISMVEAMDAGIGRLLDALDDLGLADNTLVFFTYDHNGRHLVRNDPFSGGFATLNEGGIRVPLIVRWPARLSADERVDKPAIGMDIAATALSAAGVASLSLNLDGRDLLQDGAHDNQDRFFFWRLKLGDFGQAAVRHDNWKLLVHRYVTFSKPTVYLYDLASDPGESKDLYHQQQALADRLHRELIEWETSIAAPNSPES
jgi:arylsulfatase A-like enzyme